MAKRLRRDRISKKLTHYIRVLENPSLYPTDPILQRSQDRIINYNDLADVKNVSRFFSVLSEDQVHPPLLVGMVKSYVPIVDTVFSHYHTANLNSTIHLANLIKDAQTFEGINPDKFAEFDRFLYQYQQAIHKYLFRKDKDELRTPIMKAFNEGTLTTLYGKVAQAAKSTKPEIDNLLVSGYLLSTAQIANSLISKQLQADNDKFKYGLTIQFFNRKVDEPLFALKDLRNSLIKAVSGVELNIKNDRQSQHSLKVWDMLTKVNTTLTDYNAFPPPKTAIGELGTDSAVRLFQQTVSQTLLLHKNSENVFASVIRKVSDGTKRLWNRATGKSVQLSAIAVLEDLNAKASVFNAVTSKHANSYQLINDVQVKEDIVVKVAAVSNERLAQILEVNLDEVSLDDYMWKVDPTELTRQYQKTENKQEFIELLQHFKQTAKYIQAQHKCSLVLEIIENLQELEAHADQQREPLLNLENLAVIHEFGNQGSAEKADRNLAELEVNIINGH